LGIEKVTVLINGVGSGRESALRSLAARGLEIIAIRDITPTPHNGCRPPKVRRV
jgi:small subunit ribosomal protein S11